MATFGTQIQAITGTITDTNLMNTWLLLGAKYVIDLLPDHVLNEYAVVVTVTTSGISLSSYRVQQALKNGYEAPLVSSGMLAAVQDGNSLHYAIEASPVSIIYNGKIYIYPNGGEVLAMSYPSLVDYSASAISNFPSKMLHGVVLYASMQGLLHKFSSSITELSALTIPTAPAAPSYSFVDVTGATITAPSFPTYTKPTTTFSITDLSDYINTSDEDLDQAQLEAKHQDLLLNKFQMDLYNELNETNAEIESTKGTLQRNIEVARLAQEAGILNSTKDLEAAISEYQSKLNKYQTEIQSYASQSSNKISNANEYSKLFDKVKIEFDTFIKGIIGSNG